jgi:hypothetical protein
MTEYTAVVEGGSPDPDAANAQAVGLLQVPLALFTAPGAFLDPSAEVVAEAG